MEIQTQSSSLNYQALHHSSPSIMLYHSKPQKVQSVHGFQITFFEFISYREYANPKEPLELV